MTTDRACILSPSVSRSITLSQRPPQISETQEYGVHIHLLYEYSVVNGGVSWNTSYNAYTFCFLSFL